MARTFDVTSVDRSADLSRMLLVRVGPRWPDADPELRREAAEEWLHMWQAAVANGVVAVLDGDGEDARSIVSFDANGRAWLKDPPGEPSPSPKSADAPKSP